MSEYFEDLSGLNLSDLDACEIQDSNGQRVGRLIDAVLKKTDKGMDLTKFVVGDSKLVEFLERIGLRDDIDPVFTMDVIAKVRKSRIRLNIAKEELKSTHLHQDALDTDEYRLSSLKRTPVIDSNGANIGRVIDLKFDAHKFHLILGDSVLVEWAEDIGLQLDIDFLIDPEYIKEFSKDKIVLSKGKDDLKSTFMKNIDEYQKAKDIRAQEAENRGAYYFPTYYPMR